MKIKPTFGAPLLIIFIMLMLCAAYFVDLGAPKYQENICLAILVLQFVVILVPALFYMKLRGEGYTKRLRFVPFGVEKLLVTLLAVVVLVLGDTLIRLLLHNFGLDMGDYSPYTRYLGITKPNLLYSLITFVLVPAIAEEFVFRAVLCTEYEKSSIGAAIIASSLLYGMFGLNLELFPVYFFAGLIYALIYYLTGSAFAPMLCHLCFNLYGLALGNTVISIISKPQSTGFLIFVLASFFLLTLAALFGECERIYYGYSMANKPSEHVNPAANIRTFAEALLAPPILAAAVIFIGIAYSIS